MGNSVSKSQVFMEQRERTNTEYRKQGTLSMNLVREEFNRDIQEVYDLRSGELLGKGGFGTVRVVTHKATQNKYALKTIELKDVETVEQYEFLLNEIEIMKQLDHPNIARVQEVFHTPDHYYMVMDLYTGGDMYARYKFRSEDETAKIVNKLINALRYCHDRNVAHRDIKLENICFESMADDAEVKLVDFGLSASFKDEQLRHDLVGSWAFMAPEVLQRAHHPQACDLWSMGVITYCLLAGFPPFRSVNLKGLKEQILYSKVTFEEEPWKNVSNTAKDFILKLLKKDPQKRWTAQQAQQHPWLTRARSNKKNAKLSPKVVENLMQFKSLNLMKRVALGVVARTLEASEMRNLEQEFHKADIARSGEISIEDFRAVLLRSNQFQRKELDEIFEGLDIGSSGLLSYTDFTAAALNRQHLDTRRLKYAFERLDHDNNGYLDYEDLMMTVGSDLSNEDVRKAIKQFDTDNDGKVSFDDFCRGMRSTGGALDALSTAQLTSAYMVESIAKGEGAAAIQNLVAEDLTPSKVPSSAEKLVPPLRQQLKQRQLSGEGQGNGGHPRDAHGDGAGVGVETAENTAAPPPPPPAAAAAAAGRPNGIDSTGTNCLSSAETAALSRPQSPDGHARAAAALVADVDNAAIGADGESDSRTKGMPPLPPGRPAAAAAQNAEAVAAGSSIVSGHGAAVGPGGAEATAPAARKWSQEVSPGGGARSETPRSPRGRGTSNAAGGVETPSPAVPGTAVGGGAAAAAAAATDHWSEGLAGRRMRDSIRLRAGLGGLQLPPLGTTPPSNATTTDSLSAQPPPPKGGGTTTTASPSSSSQAPPSGTSPNLYLDPSSTTARARLPPPPLSLRAGAAPHPPRAAAGGALGAAAGSAKSGGDPAESSESRPSSFLRKTAMVPMVAADLPPRDSTAGEADLGWGSQGWPADLQSTEVSSGSSLGGTTMRSPKLLRFGGVTPGSKSKRKKKGKEKGGSAEESGGGRSRRQVTSLFCTPGARQAGGRGNGGGGGGDGEGSVVTCAGGGGNVGDDVYRNYDSVSLDNDAGAQPKKRTGTFCMPGNETAATAGGHVLFWVKWMDDMFRGKPE